jgi:hypothetical protein
LADYGSILGEGWSVKEGGEEIFRDVVCVGGEGTIPFLPWWVVLIKGEVIKDVQRE